MASTNVQLNDVAYQRLLKQKQPGESFSDVILREVPEPWVTAGDILQGLKDGPPPPINRDRLALVRSTRGRPSNRPNRQRKA